MAQNKSKIAREFWRDIIDNNKIDLSNSDARKEAVNQFLNNPENKGWKAADRRFFRLGFDKICKERGLNTHQFGIKPEPKRIKTKTGQMNINIKTDEKKVHPLFRKEEEAKEKEEEAKEEPKHDIKNAQQLTEQQAAAIYTGDSVGSIFAMMFRILNSRFPECSPLTPQETKALGEAWYPLFNEYLAGTGGKWIMPIVVTAPICIVRFSEYSRKKKEKEIEEEILHDMPKDPEANANTLQPDEKPKSWSEKL
jgi:hypothetical protein